MIVVCYNYILMFGRKIHGFVSRHLEFLLLFSVAIIMTIVTIYTWDVKYQNQIDSHQNIIDSDQQNEIDFNQY